jgi:hypothetical protein
VTRNLSMYGVQPQLYIAVSSVKPPNAAPMITIGKILPFDAVSLKLGVGLLFGLQSSGSRCWRSIDAGDPTAPQIVLLVLT